jgi:3'(2'), 5'-bisphosphate nucleotidase
MDFNKRKDLLIKAVLASLKAGREIIKVYQSKNFQVHLKSDNTPLTIADQRAHQTIDSAIGSLGIPVLSEEGEHLNFNERQNWEYCWIVDPLDGTKEFIKRNDEFTVNIALINKKKPVAGVIYVPVYKQLYFADIELGAYRINDIIHCDEDLEALVKRARKLPLKKNRKETIVVGSRSHMNTETKQYIQKLMEEHDKIEMISKGSSLKLCMIAENLADIYPRFSPTMEWDIAAGHAIVAASGGKVLDFKTGKEITYNKKKLMNPNFICKR